MKIYKRLKALMATLLAVSMAASLTGCFWDDLSSEEKYDEDNVGEIYYSSVDEDHIATNDNGTMYADNEVLLVASEEADKSDIEALAGDYDAEIVGYIEQTGDYQLKFDNTLTESEIDEIITKLEESEFVDSASMNYISEVSEDSVDYDINSGSKWVVKNPGNTILNADKSWGVEAINAQYAWVIMNLYKAYINPIRVGLIDSGFDEDHEDLGFAEGGIFYDGSNGVEDIDSDHGTHVAGTMAAIGNNEDGICGVYPYGNGNLYAVSKEGVYSKNGRKVTSTIAEKIALAELILRNVKVINHSMNNGRDRVGKIVKKEDNWESALTELETNANILGNFLDRLIKKGYEFTIVSAAGNGSNASGGDRGLESKYNSFINAIDEKTYPDVYNRIIVVGAVNNNLEIANYSNAGDRVDIFAPGGDGSQGVYSTLPGNTYGDTSGNIVMSGTSMASPHVAGVCADVWSIDNSLTGAEVKQIVCSSIVDETESGDYPVVDCAEAVKTAIKNSSNISAKDVENGGVLGWVYASDNSTPIEDVNVVPYITGASEPLGDEYNAKTDKYGHFELIIPAGEYDLHFTKDNYREVIYHVTVQNGEVNYLDDFIILKSDALTSFTIPTDLTLTLGENAVIEPTIEPADAAGYSVTWTSSDDSVVSIISSGSEECVLHAGAKGEATITASTTVNGESYMATTSVRVASEARDTVLALDISGSMSGEPVEEMKEAAIDFCDQLLTDEYNNRVGIVLYDDDVETIPLTSDLSYLKTLIGNIDTGGSTNMEGGVSAAVSMLDNESGTDSIKNIVIMADGLPNEGEYSDSGSFESLLGTNTNDSYSYLWGSEYEYENAVLDTATAAMSKYNFYSLGFFHNLGSYDMSDCQTLMQGLTNMTDGYHQVEEAENLQFAFGDIAEDISDGSKIVINIACPVDVSVSYNGETLSSDSASYNGETSFGSIQLLGKDQDIKIVTLDPNNTYDIELTGTDDGVMNYSVNYLNENDTIEDYRSFEEVPITPETNITSSTDNSDEEVALNIDTDGDGTVDEVWTAKKNESGSVKQEEEPETEAATEPETSGSIDGGIILIAVLVFVAFALLIVALAVGFNAAASKKSSKDKEDKEDAFAESERKSEQPEPIEDKIGMVAEGDFADKSELELKDGETVYIGTDKKYCRLAVSRIYSKVSPIHCSVTYSEKYDTYYVVDCSVFGTTVNSSTKLEKGKRTAVARGSELILCDRECRVRLR